MTNKQRITKLENSVSTAQTEETSYRFTHEVREDGDRFYIDAFEVDAARYAKERAEYHAESNMPIELIIYCNGEDNPKGSITIIDHVDDEL
jgi:hypothetical protein